MENKLLNKEISEEKLGLSSDLRHTVNSLQNTFHLLIYLNPMFYLL